MDRFDALTAFVAVAQAGGFSAASRALGVPVATVSRNVALLEAALGVRLFTRSTRHVALTEPAQRYYEACRRVLDDLREADAEVVGEHRDPRGELVITAPLGFGRQHLQPVVHAFLQAYPQVDVQLLLADRTVALVEEHVDAALRIGALADSALVARRLGEIRLVVCGAPSYLSARGTPQHPDELASHVAVAWTGRGPQRSWSLQLSPGRAAEQRAVRTRLTTTTPESAVQAAIDGLGLVQATSYQLAPAVARGELVPLLRAFEPPPLPVSFVHASRRLAPLKLQAFLEFATPRLEAQLAEVARVL